MARSPAAVWRGVAAAWCAVLVGIGLARFAYSPLIPAIIDAGWFAPGAAAYLGAANFAGYLAGALLGQPIAARAGIAGSLRAAMLVAAGSFLACAAPLPFEWFFAWRFAAGLAGGILMVVAAPAALAGVPPSRRGLAGGAVFAGVGLGVAASGTLVPLFMRWGLVETWLALGAIASLFTALAWNGWPTVALAPPVRAAPAPASARLRALYATYALNAVGLVPHMVFLADFVARGLGRGLEAGAAHWVLFGVGAVAGPLLSGAVADRIGFRPALRLALAVQAAAVALPAASSAPWALALSSLAVGVFVPGIVPIVLGRVQELVVDDAGRRAAWSRATVGFAVGQAGAAYGFSALFAAGDGYTLLFVGGAACLVAALALDLASAGRARG